MSFSPPLSLYVHIPWCVKKCPYCDFNSHEKKADYDEPAYVDTLLLDLEHARTQVHQNQLTSIFFGGGTPSLFSAQSIDRIITRAGELFDIKDAEITLEANPGTFEQEKFAAFHDAGVNRLSIGIQSFDSNFLQSLGRIHDGEQALIAVDTAKQAGFDNINIDLMYGLPGQSIEQAMDDINIACEQNVNHVSHYQLTIEANTYFDIHTPVLPDIDTLWDMQTACQKILNTSTYQHYEVSAYAKAGKESRHNLNYWLFGDYIGIGAGAHGKFSHATSKTTGNVISGVIEQPQTQTITRQWKRRQPQDYIKNFVNNFSISGEKTLSEDEIIFDFLLNALRLKKGCQTGTFTHHTNLSLKHLKNACKDIDPKLLLINDNTIRTSDKGFLFLNEVLEQLM